jgi:hypothetical protein
MAVAIDIGEAGIFIRRTNRTSEAPRPLGDADCYGDKNIAVSGPLVAGHTVKGDKIRISFTHLAAG